MGFLDRIFGRRQHGDGDTRLQAAVDLVIESADPRLKGVGDARQKLLPAVAHALEFVGGIVAAFPPCIEMTPDNWGKQPLLRAMFARPADIAATLSASVDLRDYLAAPASQGVETIHCAVAATRTERTVLGHAMEGDMLRQDVAQKTVGFSDFRLVACSPSEAELRTAAEDVVLEGLVLAALADLAGNRERSGMLEAHRQLLLARVRLMAQGGAGLDTMLGSETENGADHDRLRQALAANEAELAALKAAPDGLDWLIESLHRAETIARPSRVVLRLNAMNVIVGAEAADAALIELTEFSTPNHERSRRVAFFAAFPRQDVVQGRMDFDAALRSL